MVDVVLKGIRKSFGKVDVIKGVDFTVEDREFAVFVGPSGCGKTTLLRLVAGLEDITSGELSIDGQLVNDRSPVKRGVAMVFQSYALYPHMSVYGNMSFGLKLAKMPRDEIDRRVRHAAEILQMGDLLERKPKELSGGQRQRVAIGRAIVREPKVFLFDEPLSNLDAALRVQMRIQITKLHEDLEATMIYVTHDQVEAMTLADKIVVLNAGNVEQVGPPLELYRRPRNLFVAGFIGSPKMNFLHGTVAALQERVATVRLAGGAEVAVATTGNGIQAGAEVTLGVRPEHMVEGGDGGAEIRGQVEVIERLGDESYLYVQLGEHGSVVVRGEGDTPAKKGETIAIGLPAAACHLFDAAGLAIDRAAQD